MISTVSLTKEQGPETVQTNLLLPTCKPVTVLLLALTLVTVAGELTAVAFHAPVPTAAKVAVVVHMF